MTAEKLAETLYFSGLSQKKIAEITEKSEATVSAWAQKNKWADKRASTLATQESAVQRIMSLIDYQLRYLEQQKDKAIQEGKLVPLDKGQIDALSKLLSGIKQKEMTFAQIVNNITELLGWLQTEDIALSKALVPFTNKFINLKKDNFDK
ncbi:Putative ATPase subunit of terminase (gpP-like) [Pseudarcicella hirudinis]|uniref:Putative ATPase subunit of terminase (GpP-like) n=2 Tax=Pseudarcicella hirudinis TaxID=1079859 RepID=A0A1I5MWT0_9BACT|nr:hypothetical protein [Pseudarcicella hirudinis]SFP13948.1 Putative ATPase subunit of terminase (gpP-like) [Pseudarcicella hirudinis]